MTLEESLHAFRVPVACYPALCTYILYQLDPAFFKDLLHTPTFTLAERNTLRAWRTWAVASSTICHLWREIVAGQRNTKDARFLLRRLPAEDKQKISLYRWTVPTRRLTDEQMHKMLKTLTPYATRLCKYRTRFVTRYDFGIDLGDLISATLEAAVRTIRRYEHLRPYTHLINTAKMAIKRELSKSLTYSNRGKRARLVAVTGDAQREYQPTVIEDVDTATNLPAEGSAIQLLQRIRIDLGDECAFVAWRALSEGRPPKTMPPRVEGLLHDYLTRAGRGI